MNPFAPSTRGLGWSRVATFVSAPASPVPLAVFRIGVAAVLLVHPRDFFVVGVCPPLIMGGVFTVLAVLAPGALAEPSDGFLQAVVSGLAHHAGALVVGYGLTLGLLALRQMALRNAGAIRAAAKRSRIEV